MKRNRRELGHTILIAVVLMIAALFVSCNDNVTDPVSQKGIGKVTFDLQQTKWISGVLDEFNPDDYYWSYKAEPLTTSGLEIGNTNGVFENWNDDKGLDGDKEFSAGKWLFTLRAFSSNTRSADSAVLEGEAEGTVKIGSTLSLFVPLSYMDNCDGTTLKGNLVVDLENLTFKNTFNDPEFDNYFYNGSFDGGDNIQLERTIVLVDSTGKVTTFTDTDGNEVITKADAVLTSMTNLDAGIYDILFTYKFYGQEGTEKVLLASYIATYGAAVHGNVTRTVSGELEFIKLEEFTITYKDGMQIYGKDGTTVTDTTFTDYSGNNKDTLESEYNVYSYGKGLALPDATSPTGFENTKDGYVFTEWNTEPDFSGTSLTDLDKSYFGDKVLYAKWTPLKTEIVLSACGKGTNGSAEVYYNEKENSAFVAVTPTDSAYEVYGYFTSPQGGYMVLTSTGDFVPCSTTTDDTLGAKYFNSDTDLFWALYNKTSTTEPLKTTLYAQYLYNGKITPVADFTEITVRWRGVADYEYPVMALENTYTVYTSESSMKFTEPKNYLGKVLEYIGTEDGTPVIYPDGTFAHDVSGFVDKDGLWCCDKSSVTLYAVWQIKPFTIKVDLNERSFPEVKGLVSIKKDTYTVCEGDEFPMIQIPSSTDSDITFMGWSLVRSKEFVSMITDVHNVVLDQNGYTKDTLWVKDRHGFDTEVTLYARWRTQNNDVDFDPILSYTDLAIMWNGVDGNSSHGIRTVDYVKLPYLAEELPDFTRLLAQATSQTDDFVCLQMYIDGELTTITDALLDPSDLTEKCKFIKDVPDYTNELGSWIARKSPVVMYAKWKDTYKADPTVKVAYTDASIMWGGVESIVPDEWTQEYTKIKTSDTSIADFAAMKTRCGISSNMLGLQMYVDGTLTTITDATGKFISDVDGITNAQGEWITTASSVTLYAIWPPTVDVDTTITLGSTDVSIFWKGLAGGTEGLTWADSSYIKVKAGDSKLTFTLPTHSGTFNGLVDSTNTKVVNADGTPATTGNDYWTSSGTWKYNKGSLELYATW